MKNILTSSFVLLASAVLFSAFGAANDTIITFSTPGPDKYADGTVVKDGECYALVWTKTGAAFAGIAADGKAVGGDSEVMAFVPVAKGGRCPTVAFEIDADLAESYKDGSYGIYLLDTRLADGRVGGLDANGVPVAVNGYGAVRGEGSGQGRTESISSVAGAAVAVTAKSSVPEDAPKPQITAIKVVGDKVYLTVKGTVPYLQYKAEEALQTPQASQKAATQGAATADEEITVVAPKEGNSGFYRVSRD